MPTGIRSVRSTSQPEYIFRGARAWLRTYLQIGKWLTSVLTVEASIFQTKT
jgi:hypothetical protein